MPSIITNGAGSDNLQIAFVSDDPRQANYNQGEFARALNNGGPISILDPGTYHVVSDSFTYPRNTSLTIGPGVQFAINGTVQPLYSLSPIVSSILPDKANVPTNTVILMGDSFLERSFASAVTATNAGTDNGDGTTTINLAATPLSSTTQTAVGDTIRLNDSSVPKNNQFSAQVTAISTSPTYSITYTNTGPYSSLVGSGNPFVILERELSCLGFFPYLRMLAGGNIDVIANASQGGATVEQALEVFNYQVNRNVFARFGLWCVGRNDIYAKNYTYAQVVASAKRLIASAMKQCKFFIAVTVPPQDSTLLGGTWSTAKMQTQLQYEAWVKEYVLSQGGYVIDAATAASNNVMYRDSTSANSNPTSGWTTDGAHPNNLSAHALGMAILSQIQSLLIPQQRWIHGVASTYANDPSIITDNPLLTGTAGTVTNNSGVITGTAPDSWIITVDSGTAAVTTSLVARTGAADGDTAGNWLRLVITTSGASQVSIKQNITTSRLSNGDTVRGQHWVRLSSLGSPGSGNPAAVIGLTNYCRVNTATTLFNEAQSLNGTGVALTQGIGTDTTKPVPALITPWMTIRTPASYHGAVASGFVQTVINFSGAGGATLDIAHACMKRKVT